MKYYFTILTFLVSLTLVATTGEGLQGTVTLSGTTGLTTENPLVQSSTENILMAFTLTSTSDTEDTVTTIEFNSNIDLASDLLLSDSRLYITESSTLENSTSTATVFVSEVSTRTVTFTFERALTTTDLYFYWATSVGDEVDHNTEAIQFTLSSDDIILKDGSTATGETLTSESFIFETICASNDRDWLISLYNDTDGGSWTDNTNWTNSTPLSDWSGVLINDNGCVRELLLNSNNLVGPMPDITPGSMTEVINIDLAINQLSGSIPTTINNMLVLEVMSLQNNLFEGEIPWSFYQMPTLRQVSLSNNSLTGKISNGIDNLSQLEVLDLGQNSLSGDLPKNIGGLGQLKSLLLSDNSFTGPIPLDYENLTNLEVFQVAGNSEITGSLPDYFYSFNNLTGLNLDFTSLAGAIKEDIVNLPISSFDITSTELCEPTSSTYTSWVSGLTNYGTSGLSCSEITIDGLSRGLSAGTLGAESANVAVVGFSVVSEVGTTISDISINTSGDLSSLSNFRLVSSTDNDYATSDDNTEIGIFSVGSTSIEIASLSIGVSGTATNLFVIADVVSGVNVNTENIQFDLSSTGVVLASGHGATSLTIQYGPYAFESSENARDREALESLFISTNGSQWTYATNWLTDEPIENWHGVIQGGLIAEKWTTSGEGLEEFKTFGSFPEDPEEIFALGQFESYSDIGDNYGLRISGVFEAPETGNYTFWIVGDDDYELYLSPDETRGNASLIASGTAKAQYDWTGDASQQSSEVSLVAGERHYIEAIFVEFGGADHIAVGWTLPSDVSGSSGPTEIIPESVFVDDKGVQGLDLRYNNLSGTLPARFTDFADLRFVDFQQNNVAGELPSNFDELSSLKRFVFWGNRLTGDIPAAIGGLSSLVHLNLDRNDLGGNIPAEMGNLSNLQLLSLSENGFVGGIPEEFGNLSDLYFLRVSNTGISGSIPSQIGSLGLTFLDLSGNNLTGSIPDSFNNLVNLNYLSLSYNELTGSIPDLSSLSSLEYLGLRTNDLSGSIPNYLNTLLGLHTILLDDNGFSGELPDLQSLSNLNYLYVHRNSLTGQVPTTYSQLTNMILFIFSETGICEPTDDADFNTWKDNLGSGGYVGTGFNCDNTTFAAIYDEQLQYLVEGTADSPLFKWSITAGNGGTFDGVTFNYSRTLEGELSNFRVIRSADDDFDDSDDNEVVSGLTIVEGANSVTLDDFNLTMSSDPAYYLLVADVSNGVNYDNQYIQLFLSQDDVRVSGVDLNTFSWGSNNYFFESICSTNARGILTDFYNATSGEAWYENEYWTEAVPLYNWSRLGIGDNGCVTELGFTSNNLNGTLPSGLIGDLFQLTILRLEDNHLDGEFPSDIGTLTELRELDFGRNRLTGTIPDIFDDWGQIEVFGVAGNNFEGPIPESVGANASLRYLYLDNNNFSEDLPYSLSNLTALEHIFLTNNPELTGAFPVGITTSGTLNQAGFDNTMICEPITSAEYNDWKTNVMSTGFFSGTDITCSTDTELLSISFLEDPAAADFTNAPLITFLVDKSTDERFLTSEFTLSTGARAFISDVVQESGVTVNDFTEDVIYQVVAEDGVTSQDWTIQVTREANNESDITVFSIPEQTEDAVFSDISDEIDIEVAYGTDPSNVVPEFILSPGATAAIGGNSQESGVSTVDFSSGSVTYDVTSEDLSLVKNWLVNLSVALNDSAEIKSLIVNNSGDVSILGYEVNADLSSWSIELFNQASFPELILDFELSGDAAAFVNNVEQTSGVSSQDFSSGPVEYLVRAQNGNERTWTVELNIFDNIGTDITSFNIDGQNSSSIDEVNRTIDVEMPVNTALNSLQPNFELSFGATAFVNTIQQTSGSSQVDFSQGSVTYTVIAEDGTTQDSWTVTVIAVTDDEDPSISGTVTPGSYTIGSGGFDVTAQASDNLELASVEIFFKQSSDEAFSSETLLSGIEGYTKSFQDNNLDNIGVDYYFVATDGVGNSAFTEVFTTSAVVNEDSKTVSNISFGTTVENYRIIAFPFNNPNASTLLSELGSYDETQWRLLRWSGSAYQDLDQFNSLSAGVGYFFLSRNSVTLQVGGQSVTTSNGEYRFPLTSTGYNLIGNPFIGTLTWSDVIQYNVDNGYISTGDISSTLIGYVSGEVSRPTLSPFEGAWLQVNVSSPNFVIPVTASNGSGRADFSIEEPKTFNLDDTQWELNFYLKSNNLNHNAAGIGLNEASSSGQDYFDLKKLPRFQDFLALELDNELSRSVKPKDRIVRWDLNISSSLKEKDFNLSWDKPISSIYSLLLVDKNNGRIIDLASVSQMGVRNNSADQYEIIYGRTSEIYDYLDLEFSSISLLYPNPVEDQINVELYSHLDGEVKFTLTDLNGKELVSQGYVVSKGINSLSMQLMDQASLKGLALLKITTADGRTISTKIIKQ